MVDQGPGRDFVQGQGQRGQLPIVASNLVFSATDPGDDAFEAVKNAWPIPPKLVKTMPGGLKVGFFGLVGAQAASFAAAAAPLTFSDIKVAAAAEVADLRTNDKVDLVIALSHSGIDSLGNGEDRNPATAVPGIDIIISGHTHQKLVQPVVVGKTIIVTAGSYGEYLGKLDLEVSKAGGVVTSVAVKSYVLQPIDDAVPAAPLCRRRSTPSSLGWIGADAADVQVGGRPDRLRSAAAAVQGKPAGQSGRGRLPGGHGRAATNRAARHRGRGRRSLRAPVLKGKTGQIWFADLFRVTPIGIGPDGQPGYPLVSYYLSGADLRVSLEIGAGANVAPLADDAYFLQLAGIKATYNLANPLFQRVTAASLTGLPGGAVPASPTINLQDTTHCYKVVTTLYLAELFNFISTFSGGLLAVTPKEKDCTTAITDITTHMVDADPVTAGVQELKNYKAVLGYISKFPDTDTTPDGIPNIPAAYGTAQGRITTTP